MIDRPPQASRFGAGLVFAALLVLTATGPLPRSLIVWLPALLFVLGYRARQPQAVHIALFGLLYYAGNILARGWWPLPHAITLSTYGLMVWGWPWLRSSAGWIRRGHLGRRDVGMIAAFAVVSAIGLVVWRFTTSTDLSHFRSLVPDGPLWVVVAGMVGIALLNAALEEAMWRGVIMHALDAALPSRLWVWLIQAVAFGIWHYRGFPSGWVGMGLAAVFAAMMGALRIHSRGILAPWIAHVLADLTIFTMIACTTLGN